MAAAALPAPIKQRQSSRKCPLHRIVPSSSRTIIVIITIKGESGRRNDSNRRLTIFSRAACVYSPALADAIVTQIIFWNNDNNSPSSWRSIRHFAPAESLSAAVAAMSAGHNDHGKIVCLFWRRINRCRLLCQRYGVGGNLLRKMLITGTQLRNRRSKYATLSGS